MKANPLILCLRAGGAGRVLIDNTIDQALQVSDGYPVTPCRQIFLQAVEPRHFPRAEHLSLRSSPLPLLHALAGRISRPREKHIIPFKARLNCWLELASGSFATRYCLIVS